MTLSRYFAELTSYLPFLPAAFLCYFPVKNQLKFKKNNVFLCICPAFLLCIPVVSYFTCRFSLNENFFTLPLLILFFVLFQFSVRTTFCQSLSVFVFVCALLSFSANFTNGYDAVRYPQATAFVARLDTNLFHFSVSLLMLVLLAYPLSRYGSFLIDSLTAPNIWYMTVLISGTFLGLNILIVPHKHETLYVNRIFLIFWSLLGIMFAMMMMIYVLFYFIAIGMLESAKIAERNHFLETQEAQYLKQCRYMEETARIRHDFHHTLHTLKMLSEESNYASLNRYLDEYLEALPVNQSVTYCQHNSVNALLNYLIPSAQEAAIDINLNIDLPNQLTVTDIDLCCILGNVLENAIDGCKTLPTGKRSIQLTVTTRLNAWLYIVSTNTFNGNIKRKNDQYQTTKKNGHGIGLTSTQITEEKYNGSAQFSNDTSCFYVDIMIPIA